MKPTAKAHGQVGAPPKEVGPGAAGSKISVPPRNVGDGLVGADVGEGALVGVVEGLDVLDAAELALQLLDSLCHLGGRLCSGPAVHVEVTAELADLRLERLGTCHVVEEPREE